MNIGCACFKSLIGFLAIQVRAFGFWGLLVAMEAGRAIGIRRLAVHLLAQLVADSRRMPMLMTDGPIFWWVARLSLTGFESFALFVYNC